MVSKTEWEIESSGAQGFLLSGRLVITSYTVKMSSINNNKYFY